MNDEEVVVRNFRGDQYVYKQPQPELVPMGASSPEYLFRSKKGRKRAVKNVKAPAVKAKRKTA
jgi:hypothetical protein